jgi:hypothetical protein
VQTEIKRAIDAVEDDQRRGMLFVILIAWAAIWPG